MIRVKLKSPSDRKFILATWEDPVTGQPKFRSTKTKVRREAERFAARLEDELNSGTYRAPSMIGWDEFRERYTTEAAGSHAPKTRAKNDSTFNAIEEWKKPKSPVSISASYISEYQSHLRLKGRSEHTIRGHLTVIRKALNWAKKMEMIKVVPSIVFPANVDPAKGRAVTTEEFERLLKIVDTEIKEPFREKWKHYLRGMWLSGLRLEESLLLHWTNDKFMTPDFSSKYPMLRIQSAAEKGKAFRLLPITPDFAAFLKETPVSARKGFVFNPDTVIRGLKTGVHRPTADHVGKVVARLGKKALIKVSEKKFASIHDLRRSFGERWALLVMPKVLQELMRHGDIKTTMQYYVGNMSQDTAAAVYNAMQRIGNTFGNSSPHEASPDQPERAENASK